MRRCAVVIAIAGLAMAGCSGGGDPPAAAVAVAKPAAPAVPAVSGVLSGPFGAPLSDADRQRAFDAQTQALETGKRQSWRGDQGLFGYVEPGAESSALTGGKCREYSHTLYQAGRPRTASGSACRQADGGWRA